MYLTMQQADSETWKIDDLGGKGFGLVRMIKLGLRVPPFVIFPTTVCKAYQMDPEATMAKVKGSIPFMREYLTAMIGYEPLVSVRSGAKVSMPGMMDTILNVGLTTKNFDKWCDRVNGPCMADSAGRLSVMYKDVVGQQLPDDVDEQLLGAIEAVFKSWNNERAMTYRNLNKISHDMGTAVVVQAMVFGNLNDKSCTGVLFTRNPSNGADEVTGEFLVNAQGEDVVAGIRTPEPLTKMGAWSQVVADELLKTVEDLELKSKDMQDVEFTVQDGVLYFLQTRNAKRTAQAAVKIAVDMFNEGLIDGETVMKRVSLKQMLGSSRPFIAEPSEIEPTVVGLPASNGVVSGVAVTSSKDAVNCKEDCILVTDETTPDDIAGMIAAKGILTRKGGATSHAAVVARGMDKVAVVGCTDLPDVLSGTRVTICGTTGRVWLGMAPPVQGGGVDKNVEALKAIIRKVKGYTRVCSKPEEVEAEGCVYIAACGTPADLSTAVSKMKTGIVDLSLKEDLVDDAERVMMGLYGTLNGTGAERLAAWVDVVIGAKPEGLSVIPSTHMTESDLKSMEQVGVKVIRRLTDLNGLIMADGLTIFDKNSKKSYAPKHVIDKVMKMKKALGEKIVGLSIVEKAPHDAKLGAEDLMSDLQAAQSFLA